MGSGYGQPTQSKRGESYRTLWVLAATILWVQP
jgi:hypothetical protein